MVNLLFFIATAIASDVYEVCRHEKQLWNERAQRYDTKYVSTFYSREKVQFIIHNNSFEVNRDVRNIQQKFTQDGMNCWREHENSFFCYDETHNNLLWEFYKKNGDVTRDVMSVCIKNGEPID
jgi:hypothetical protein